MPPAPFSNGYFGMDSSIVSLLVDIIPDVIYSVLVADDGSTNSCLFVFSTTDWAFWSSYGPVGKCPLVRTVRNGAQYRNDPCIAVVEQDRRKVSLSCGIFLDLVKVRPKFGSH